MHAGDPATTSDPALHRRARHERHALELARERNVVVKTDGAAPDKVRMATLLLRQQQGYAESMRAFLLAPTREAVVGIAASLHRELGPACSGAFYGSRVEFWDKDDWDRALRDTAVLVCTPQVLCRAVEQEYVSTQRISLLILEDCHLAKKRHPYAQLVRLCSERDAVNMPRIVGMSAHPTQMCADVLDATLVDMESCAEDVPFPPPDLSLECRPRIYAAMAPGPARTV